MSKNVRTEAVDHLFDAILSLENKEECYKFFEDVCTVNELLAFSQRYEVAKMLREQRTYLDIAEKTGASTASQSVRLMATSSASRHHIAVCLFLMPSRRRPVSTAMARPRKKSAHSARRRAWM